MDFNRLLQGLGGRLLRQAMGILMQKGIERMGGPEKPRHEMTQADREGKRRTKETQQRLNQVMKIGRRFLK